MKYSHRVDEPKSCENAWRNSIEGFLAEVAVAKHLGLFHSGAFDLGAPDLSGLEVRHSVVPDAHLIIRPHERDKGNFCLVTGSMGDYWIRGWFNTAGLHDGFWQSDSWWIPQGDGLYNELASRGSR
ncbi:MAG: hypothetical protein GTO41_19975 [Burkholderiales bacterium]|nr:hypothetical protein [Burkholderiales bacterium]